jgi:glutamyl-tRNA synthetase/nondiscriminating glutamyl-tRNA synthetase
MLHVGNARTALYNWLFARRSGGTFVLRIEDTDVERSEQRHETQLMEDLLWLGLGWDEGPMVGGPFEPYRQSERLPIYAAHTEQLLAGGQAYRCFCTVEQLEADRQKALATHQAQNYQGRCRAIPPEESGARAAGGESFAVRLRIPDHPLRFRDLVRGEVEFPSETISDPVLVRSGTASSGGMPVYNYVVTVDDALMSITHVIRGDDHISNTPRQVAIYEAFGWKVPIFAHLSTILGADRERLSKRHGATSVASFREMGILPEALVNYLALLGWGAEGGTRETFTAEELVREFKLERVTASPAVFDWDKLHWLNRHYLKQASAERLRELAWPYFVRAGLLPPREQAGAATAAWLESLIALLLPSLDQLDQLPARSQSIFGYDAAAARADPENAALLATGSAQRVLAAFAVRAATGPAEAATFKLWMNEIKSETGVKGKDLFHPIRIALTGTHSGPEFDKLLPVIEHGSMLALAVHVPSVRERIDAFLGGSPAALPPELPQGSQE